MNSITLNIIFLFSLVFFILVFYGVRLLTIQQKKRLAEQKDLTQVGFVVDTFHELVAKLKDKERELDDLRKNAEERALSIGIYNEHILQSVPSGVISFDDGLRLTKMNVAAARILGMDAEGAVGKHHSDIFGNPVSAMIEDSAGEGRTEAAYFTQSGKRIWLGYNVSPLKDGAGKIIGKILIFTDLTELKAFQSRTELRERLSSLGEMSAGIAHELKNPMAVISGYTKMLSKKVDPSAMKAVEAIAGEIAVMDRIINDFLSFARPVEPVFAPVDLAEVLSACINTVVRPNASIETELSIDHLPVVKADEVLLRQAFINLLQNAVEAMPDGGRLRIDGEASTRLNVTIADTGHGIEDSIKEKIFLPFFTTKEKGTGLGLSIVHKIVVSHGGEIRLQSSEKGTSFTLSFPLSIIV